MSFVELIEPINVEIEQIDKDETPYSDGVSGRRENYGSVTRKPKVTIQAQVVFGNTEQQTKFSQLGPDEQAGGYILIRYEDMTNLGVVFKRGDKIVKLGQLERELFILHSSGDSAAHYNSIGGFTLVKLFFGDRNPVGD